MTARKRAARVDGNQKAIVMALQRVGVVVADCSAVGGGFNDLVCAIPEATFLLEIKSPGERLNQRQLDWHRRCPWRNHVVWDIAQALAVVAHYRGRRMVIAA